MTCRPMPHGISLVTTPSLTPGEKGLSLGFTSSTLSDKTTFQDPVHFPTLDHPLLFTSDDTVLQGDPNLSFLSGG